MEKQATDYDLLIAKYLDSNKISQEEKDVLLDWIHSSEENHHYFKQISKTWEKSIIELQDKAEARLSLREYYQQRIKKQRIEIYRWTMSVAAVAIFIFAGFLLFDSDFSFGENLLVANSGNVKQEIVLSDGTIVWLNSNSSLKYPSKFKRNRNVFLTGEAFFDVTSNDKKPFLVHTENLIVEVKGTSFVVTDYLDATHCETVLESGLVSLTINSLDKKIEMKPNQQVIYNRTTGEASLHEVNAANHTSWRAQSLVFENNKLSEVFTQLEKWYNIEITCTNADLLQIPVSLTVDEESIEEVLDLLQHITSINWKRITTHKILIF